MVVALATVQVLLMALGFSISLAEISGKWENPINAAESCANKTNWTLLPHALDCNKFYTCANQMPKEYSCSHAFYFDHKLLRCVRGTCPYSGAGLPAVQVKECQSGAYQRVEGNCNAYTICDDRMLSQRNCQQGFYFNPATMTCQPIDNTPEHKCSCLLPEHTVITNVDNCETYYICIGGRADLRQCPLGQYYDKRTSSCLPDLNGVCLMTPTMVLDDLTTIDACAETPSIANSIFRQSATDCSEFYMCINGRAFRKHCPVGLYYDIKLNYCRRDGAKLCTAQQEMLLPPQQKPLQMEVHIPLRPLRPLHTLPPMKLFHGLALAYKKGEKSQSDSLSFSAIKREEPINATESITVAAEMPVKTTQHKAVANKDPQSVDQVANEAQVASIQIEMERERQETLPVNEGADEIEGIVVAAETSQQELLMPDVPEKVQKPSDEEAKKDSKKNLLGAQVKRPIFVETAHPWQRPLTKPTYDKLASKFMEF